MQFIELYNEKLNVNLTAEFERKIQEECLVGSLISITIEEVFDISEQEILCEVSC